GWPSQRPRCPVLPPASPDVPVELDDAAHQREQEGERVIGHLLDAVVRHVADPYPPAGRRLHVHVVEADARRRDHPERGDTRDVGCGDGLEAEQRDDVVSPDGAVRMLDLQHCALQDLPRTLEGKGRVAENSRHDDQPSSADRASVNAATTRRMSGTGPTVMRTYPGSPTSDPGRTRRPWRASSSASMRSSTPIRASTQFAAAGSGSAPASRSPAARSSRASATSPRRSSAASPARRHARPAARAAQFTLYGPSTRARRSVRAASAIVYPSRSPASPKNFEKLRSTTTGRPSSTAARRGNRASSATKST